MPEGRIKVGNVEILGLTDAEGPFPLTLGTMFPSVPDNAWEPFRQRYPEIIPAPDRFYNHFGCYLLRSEGQTILVDTGVGSNASNPALRPGMMTQDGRLLAELLATGVRPDDVDTVFFTHLHVDHVGWNLSRHAPNARATFARARHLIHQADWEYFQKPEQQEQMRYWENTLGPLEDLGLVDLLDGEKALTTEVTALPCPGHTPGHMVLLIASQGEHAVVMGDAAVHPAQVTEVEWGIMFEWDQAQAAQSRWDLFDRIESNDATVAACHFPGRGFGKLIRVGGRRYWEGM